MVQFETLALKASILQQFEKFNTQYDDSYCLQMTTPAFFQSRVAELRKLDPNIRVQLFIINLLVSQGEFQRSVQDVPNFV
jgi:hypothetical protein